MKYFTHTTMEAGGLRFGHPPIGNSPFPTVEMAKNAAEDRFPQDRIEWDGDTGQVFWGEYKQATVKILTTIEAPRPQKLWVAIVDGGEGSEPADNLAGIYTSKVDAQMAITYFWDGDQNGTVNWDKEDPNRACLIYNGGEHELDAQIKEVEVQK